MRAGLVGGAALRPTPLSQTWWPGGFRSPWINPRSFKAAAPLLHPLPSLPSLPLRSAHPEQVGSPVKCRTTPRWVGTGNLSLRMLNRKLSGIEPETRPQLSRKG